MSLAIAFAAASAHAQAAKRTLLIGAHERAGGPTAAITRALRAALADIDGHALMAPAPLDLEAVQLAIECPEETASCLGEVAERMEARVLVIPSLAKSGSELALRLLHFDARESREPKSAVRRASGGDAEAELIEAVPELVGELFGIENEPAELPPPSEQPEPAAPGTAATTSDTGQAATSSGVPVAPLIIGGAGVAAIAAGLTVGLLMQQTEDDYASRDISTEMAARAAEVERERGERQAAVANVLFGVGISAVVAAGVWLALDLGGDADPAQTALVPVLGPRSAGLSLLGTWEERR